MASMLDSSAATTSTAPALNSGRQSGSLNGGTKIFAESFSQLSGESTAASHFGGHFLDLLRGVENGVDISGGEAGPKCQHHGGAIDHRDASPDLALLEYLRHLAQGAFDLLALHQTLASSCSATSIPWRQKAPGVLASSQAWNRGESLAYQYGRTNHLGSSTQPRWGDVMRGGRLLDYCGQEGVPPLVPSRVRPGGGGPGHLLGAQLGQCVSQVERRSQCPVFTLGTGGRGIRRYGLETPPDLGGGGPGARRPGRRHHQDLHSSTGAFHEASEKGKSSFSLAGLDLRDGRLRDARELGQGTLGQVVPRP